MSDNGTLVNFTIEGNITRLTAHIGADGTPKYVLDFSLLDGELSYADLIDALENLQKDIKNVYILDDAFAEDENGRCLRDRLTGNLIPLGRNEVANEYIKTFERENRRHEV